MSPDESPQSLQRTPRPWYGQESSLVILQLLRSPLEIFTVEEFSETVVYLRTQSIWIVRLFSNVRGKDRPEGCDSTHENSDAGFHMQRNARPIYTHLHIAIWVAVLSCKPSEAESDHEDIEAQERKNPKFLG